MRAEEPATLSSLVEPHVPGIASLGASCGPVERAPLSASAPKTSWSGLRFGRPCSVGRGPRLTRFLLLRRFCGQVRNPALLSCVVCVLVPFLSSSRAWPSAIPPRRKQAGFSWSCSHRSFLENAGSRVTFDSVEKHFSCCLSECVRRCLPLLPLSPSALAVCSSGVRFGGLRA